MGDEKIALDCKPIEEVVEQYLIAIDGITATATVALPHMMEWKFTEIDKLQKSIQKFEVRTSEENNKNGFKIQNARDFAEISESIRQLKNITEKKFDVYLAKSLFTQLFAEFDAFLGKLLNVIYLNDEKLLKGISREISLSDLLEFSDLRSVKIAMLNKEIETVRRDSYIDQFSTLEKKFKIELKKFAEWSAFVELSQRRNIIMHNGGIVIEQYISVCRKEGYSFGEETNIGDHLNVSYNYFKNASRILSKVGLMLAYTLWSKNFPKDMSLIHDSLNETIYNSLLNKQWEFVSELGDFVFSQPMMRGISEINHKVRIINYCIGLKFSGKNSAVMKVIDSVDWSANYRDFKLAIEVLRENYNEAITIMKSIGKNGEIIYQHCYHTWPLFTQFREEQEFYDAYFEIYGEHFSESLELQNETIEIVSPSAPDNLDQVIPIQSIEPSLHGSNNTVINECI